MALLAGPLMGGAGAIWLATRALAVVEALANGPVTTLVRGIADRF